MIILIKESKFFRFHVIIFSPREDLQYPNTNEPQNAPP